jgi:hypothetical protein
MTVRDDVAPPVGGSNVLEKPAKQPVFLWVAS